MSDSQQPSELQEALERSIRNASPFTKSLFEDSDWDADRVCRFVNSTRNVTIATVTFGEEPHAAAVIGGCIDHTIHFTVSHGSLLERNLGHNPHVAFTICDPAHAVMGRGVAVLVTHSVDDPALIDRLAAASDKGRFTPPDWDGLIFRIEIDRIFAR
jgi:hypothetical protein